AACWLTTFMRIYFGFQTLKNQTN
ncbi:CDP-alcohol phosphatidyltransferase family protein, partial [Vibrio splendidus]